MSEGTFSDVAVPIIEMVFQNIYSVSKLLGLFVVRAFFFYFFFFFFAK